MGVKTPFLLILIKASLYLPCYGSDVWCSHLLIRQNGSQNTELLLYRDIRMKSVGRNLPLFCLLTLYDVILMSIAYQTTSHNFRACHFPFGLYGIQKHFPREIFYTFQRRPVFRRGICYKAKKKKGSHNNCLPY